MAQQYSVGDRALPPAAQQGDLEEPLVTVHVKDLPLNICV